MYVTVYMMQEKWQHADIKSSSIMEQVGLGGGLSAWTSWMTCSVQLFIFWSGEDNYEQLRTNPQLLHKVILLSMKDTRPELR